MNIHILGRKSWKTKLWLRLIWIGRPREGLERPHPNPKPIHHGCIQSSQQQQGSAWILIPFSCRIPSLKVSTAEILLHEFL